MFFPSELGAASDAMQSGRYAEAGSLYEGAAAESRAAGDTLTFRMMAVLAVNAYGRAGDTGIALRLAVATVDLLQGLGMIPEIPGVARKMLAALRAQGHAVRADGIFLCVVRCSRETRRDRAPFAVERCLSLLRSLAGALEQRLGLPAIHFGPHRTPASPSHRPSALGRNPRARALVTTT